MVVQFLVAEATGAHGTEARGGSGVGFVQEAVVLLNEEDSKRGFMKVYAFGHDKRRSQGRQL
jgi:hypothetical protein